MFDASEQYINDPLRLRFYRKLGMLPYLQRREIIKLGELPLHVELYLHQLGSPTLIFLPGIGTYVELYCELLSQLRDQGFNILALDLRGHGYSGGERGLYRVEDIIADVGSVIDYCQANLPGPIGLFGSSMGARLGLAVAEADSRIEALLCHTLFIAERPPDLWHSLGWHSLSMTNLLLPRLKVNFRTFVDVDSLLANSPLAEMADQDPLLVWDYPVSTLHSVFSYPSTILKTPLTAKSAIIAGSDDEVIPMDYLQRLIKDSAQPFELLGIPGGRHMLPFERINDTLTAASNWFAQAFNS